MNERDLISLMVEETFKLAQKSIPIMVDHKRECYVIKLAEELEIPFGFGPFHKGENRFILNSNDPYLYPYFLKLLNVDIAFLEFSLTENSIYVHLEEKNYSLAA